MCACTVGSVGRREGTLEFRLASTRPQQPHQLLLSRLVCYAFLYVWSCLWKFLDLGCSGIYRGVLSGIANVEYVLDESRNSKLTTTTRPDTHSHTNARSRICHRASTMHVQQQ